MNHATALTLRGPLTATMLSHNGPAGAHLKQLFPLKAFVYNAVSELHVIPKAGFPWLL